MIITSPIENNTERTLPQGQLKALKQLEKNNKEIYITSVVKRNRIIKMNKISYDEKNNSLLNDTDTYVNKIEQKIFAEAQKY